MKVHFRMDVDQGGWPPASVESLWAVDLGDGTVRLGNTPWFVRGVASGDVIRVEVDDDGGTTGERTCAPVRVASGPAATGEGGEPPGSG